MDGFQSAGYPAISNFRYPAGYLARKILYPAGYPNKDQVIPPDALCCIPTNK
jgi:hypothetical protein